MAQLDRHESEIVELRKSRHQHAQDAQVLVSRVESLDEHGHAMEVTVREALREFKSQLFEFRTEVRERERERDAQYEASEERGDRLALDNVRNQTIWKVLAWVTGVLLSAASVGVGIYAAIKSVGG